MCIFHGGLGDGWGQGIGDSWGNGAWGRFALLAILFFWEEGVCFCCAYLFVGSFRGGGWVLQDPPNVRFHVRVMFLEGAFPVSQIARFLEFCVKQAVLRNEPCFVLQ